MTDTNADTHESDANADASEFDVPPDATAVECAYCGRPFADERFLALHRGLAHEAAIDDAEREAFADAYEAESAALRRFRLKAVGLLVVLYFGLLMVYALVI